MRILYGAGFMILKAFSKFYRHHFDLVSKFNTGLCLNKACQNLNFMVT